MPLLPIWQTTMDAFALGLTMNKQLHKVVFAEAFHALFVEKTFAFLSHMCTM